MILNEIIKYSNKEFLNSIKYDIIQKSKNRKETPIAYIIWTFKFLYKKQDFVNFLLISKSFFLSSLLFLLPHRYMAFLKLLILLPLIPTHSFSFKLLLYAWYFTEIMIFILFKILKCRIGKKWIIGNFELL